MTKKGKDCMDPRYSVVAIHGITGESGRTQSGFSNKLAKLVMGNPAWQEEFWHEANWEEEFDDLDAKIRKVVTQLMDSYSARDLLQMLGELVMKGSRARAASTKSLWDLWENTKDRVSSFFSDLLDYAIDLPLYLGSAYGERIRNNTRERIQTVAKQADGVVVVGHSLGSVIAHDVLAQLLAESNPPPIHALVTMGSPLEWVLDLRKENPAIPPMFQSLQWVNFYNKEDPIPLKKALKLATFPKIEHFEIDAHTKNPLAAHSAYWTNEKVVEKLRELVGIRKNGVARNVMREERAGTRRAAVKSAKGTVKSRGSTRGAGGR